MSQLFDAIMNQKDELVAKMIKGLGIILPKEAVDQKAKPLLKVTFKKM